MNWEGAKKDKMRDQQRVTDLQDNMSNDLSLQQQM
jgi:hypothetical protein